MNTNLSPYIFFSLSFVLASVLWTWSFMAYQLCGSITYGEYQLLLCRGKLDIKEGSDDLDDASVCSRSGRKANFVSDPLTLSIWACYIRPQFSDLYLISYWPMIVYTLKFEITRQVLRVTTYRMWGLEDIYQLILCLLILAHSTL